MDSYETSRNGSMSLTNCKNFCYMKPFSYVWDIEKLLNGGGIAHHNYNATCCFY